MEKMYYIQTSGFQGNALIWWGIDSKGYTSDLTKAGKYTEEKAMEIINNRPEQDSAWECDYIDNNLKAQVLTVDAQYIDYGKEIKGKRNV